MATITKKPNANGTYTEADDNIPNTSARWENLSDDSDSTYISNSDTQSTTRNTFLKSALGLPAGAIVDKIVVRQRIRTAQSGGVKSYAKEMLLINSSEYYADSEKYSAGVWEWTEEEWATNPSTGSAWLEAEVDAVEFGTFLANRTRLGITLLSQSSEVEFVVYYTVAVVAQPLMDGLVFVSICKHITLTPYKSKLMSRGVMRG